MDFDFNNLLGSFIGAPTGRSNAMRCPKCGASFEEIAESGKMAAQTCYNVFRDHLNADYRRIRQCTTRQVREAMRCRRQGLGAVVEEPTPIEKKRAELKEAIEKQTRACS